MSTYDDTLNVLAELPSLVREHRRYLKLTLREVAQQTTVSFNAISRVERGGECSLANAVKLLRWLNGDAS